jgi:hypothetical protein
MPALNIFRASLSGTGTNVGSGGDMLTASMRRLFEVSIRKLRTAVQANAREDKFGRNERGND